MRGTILYSNRKDKHKSQRSIKPTKKMRKPSSNLWALMAFQRSLLAGLKSLDKQAKYYKGQ